jgi:hypothetical protein
MTIKVSAKLSFARVDAEQAATIRPVLKVRHNDAPNNPDTDETPIATLTIKIPRR